MGFLKRIRAAFRLPVEIAEAYVAVDEFSKEFESILRTLANDHPVRVKYDRMVRELGDLAAIARELGGR